MKRIRIFHLIIYVGVLLLADMPVSANNMKGHPTGADYSKMSSFVRRAAMEYNDKHQIAQAKGHGRELCAFVKMEGNADSVLHAHNCRSLVRFGNTHIVSVPLSELRALSLCLDVTRIEAGRNRSIQMDSTAGNVNALSVYAGKALPQAYTGRGVVMGIMDVGFDLTHPNFYDASGTDYRIVRLWDQLSADTVGSTLYVGADYRGRNELLGYAHSRDGLIQTHGTHTLGIAAGSGYDSRYRGMAWESDICLVNNAVTSDIPLIDADDIYKYTYATDALGFKYIFDYADEMGKPCVISFSEGSHQDLRGDDMLYYEVLENLVGPGRIIVASAGNDGYLKTFMHKPVGKYSAGSFVASSSNSLYLTMAADNDFTIRIVAYKGEVNDTLEIPLHMVQECAGGEYTDTVMLAGRSCAIEAAAYVSCYDAKVTACDVSLRGLSSSLDGATLSVELSGKNADVEMCLIMGILYDSAINPELCDAEQTHSIHSPASAPSVICVGATVYRTEFTNYQGDTFVTNSKGRGQRTDYSAVGPTLDGRTKPDVMAPGTNIISSYSSYYMEANPDARDLLSSVKLFDFGGRTYPWTSNAGTSMSAPVVGGAIALWLQACPNLTPDDVKGVISRTARRLDNVSEVPNNYWGYGEIDVYAGLLDILGISGIADIPAWQPSDVMANITSDGRLHLSFSRVPNATIGVSVYTTGGVRMAELEITAYEKECLVNLPALPSGIYAVRLTSDVKEYCGSSLVRKH